MTKLREIYNPLSDTFLVLEEHKGWLGTRFEVYRKARSPEFMYKYELHSGSFGIFSTRDESKAKAVFEERLRDEEKKPISSLAHYFYFQSTDHRRLARLGKAFDRLNVLKLQSRFGHEAYRLEVCDSPRRKLYEFEDEYFGYPSKKKLNPPQVRRLVTRVCKDIGLEVPKITFRDKPLYETHLGIKREIRAHAITGYPGELDFKKNKGVVCKRIVLHEIAHLATDAMYPEAIAHGPHFARVAANLYDRYFGIDRDRYFALADDPRYKIFGPDTHSAEDILDENFAIEALPLDVNILHLLQTTRSWLTYSPAEPSLS